MSPNERIIKMNFLVTGENFIVEILVLHAGTIELIIARQIILCNIIGNIWNGYEKKLAETIQPRELVAPIIRYLLLLFLIIFRQLWANSIMIESKSKNPNTPYSIKA